MLSVDFAGNREWQISQLHFRSLVWVFRWASRHLFWRNAVGNQGVIFLNISNGLVLTFRTLVAGEWSEVYVDFLVKREIVFGAEWGVAELARPGFCWLDYIDFWDDFEVLCMILRYFGWFWGTLKWFWHKNSPSLPLWIFFLCWVKWIFLKNDFVQPGKSQTAGRTPIWIFKCSAKSYFLKKRFWQKWHSNFFSFLWTFISCIMQFMRLGNTLPQ